MELTKINEGYTLVDTTIEGWKASGNVTREMSGNINMNCDVMSTLGDYVGNLSYHKPKEGNISLSYATSEDNREEFGNYVDTLVDSVLKELI